MHKRVCLAALLFLVVIGCAKSSSSTIPDNNGLWLFRENDKFGYVDASGKAVIPATFDHAGAFADGLAPVEVGDRWGYIDPPGN